MKDWADQETMLMAAKTRCEAVDEQKRIKTEKNEKYGGAPSWYILTSAAKNVRATLEWAKSVYEAAGPDRDKTFAAGVIWAFNTMLEETRVFPGDSVDPFTIRSLMEKTEATQFETLACQNCPCRKRYAEILRIVWPSTSPGDAQES